jgi:hypothetical protein
LGPHFFRLVRRRSSACRACGVLGGQRGGTYGIAIHRLEDADSRLYPCTLGEAIAAIRHAYGAGVSIEVGFGGHRIHGRFVRFSLNCCDSEYERRSPPETEPFSADVDAARGDTSEPAELIALPIGERSVAVDAAAVALPALADQDELGRILGASEHVRTGGASMLWGWGAPVEMGATYHVDGNVARDLALTWVHLHDGDRTKCAAALSLDALRARVEAASPGAHVNVAQTITRVEEHQDLDRVVQRSGDTRPKRRDLVRNGPRARLPGDVDLTREQVLAALSTPPATLLEALEASAMPDDEWQAAEPLAIEMLEALKRGVPTHPVNITTGRHHRWIELHAPCSVRRLPNGGVMLATHPYRILWPLWADALSLLGLKETT